MFGLFVVLAPGAFDVTGKAGVGFVIGTTIPCVVDTTFPAVEVAITLPVVDTGFCVVPTGS